MSLVLGACAGQSPGDGESTATTGTSSPSASVPTSVPTAQASASAAQLANSTTVTLNDALALAAGRLPAASVPSTASETPSTTALPPAVTVDGSVGVNPVAVDAVPTVAAATPEVETSGVTETPDQVLTAREPAQAIDEVTAAEEATAIRNIAALPEAQPASPASAPTTSTANPVVNAFETIPETVEDRAQVDVTADTESTTTAEPETAPEPETSPEPETTAEPETSPEPEVTPTAENASAVETSPAPEPAPADVSPDTSTATSPDASPATTGQNAPAQTASSGETRFSSRNTAGFVGELLDDGTVKIDWPLDPAARGYNVYRDSEYFTTVYTNSFTDDDIHDQNYYYEIQSFDYNEKFTTVAFGLTVQVSGLGRTNPDAPARNAELLEGFSLVFADEFDTGALDTTKWNTSFLWGPDLVINSESQYYVDSVNQPDFGFNPFTFENGNMVINSVPTPPALAAKANNQPYLSGIITSYDSFKFTYGYVETRARLPYGKGLWPAFWLLNAYYVDDKPEIDIMEFIGQDQDVVFHTYHYHDASDALISTASKPTKGTDWTADFHTYGVDWRPGQLIFYIDGIEVHRINDSKVSSQDMYVIANTALGGWWAGPPDESTPFPARYELDYIRVYQQDKPYESGPLNDLGTQVPTTVVDTGQSTPGRRSPGHRAPEGPWLP